MIALRQAIPVVWSSVVLTSIYIGIILLALSGWYWVWWVIAEKYKNSKGKLALILACYLIIAGIRYSLVTFGMHTELLESLLASTRMYIGALFLASIILFVVPVFLASQTLPLLTELVPIQSKGHAAWSMLFVSTIGSFLGSVLTATVLFPWIGVQMTGAITVSMVLLAWVCSVFLRNKKSGRWALGAWFLMTLGLVFTAQASDSENIIWTWDTPYHSIEIREHQYAWEDVRLMVTNGGFSSAWDLQKKQSPFPYIRSLVEHTNVLEPSAILLIGTAWFTYPAELDEQPRLQRLDAIDIDSEFLQIAQNHLLEESLSNKVIFHADSARYFLKQAIQRGDRYDLIVLDAYNGRFVPAELATVEFFEELKQVCAGDCMILSNLIIDKSLESNFAQSVVGAMQSTFGSLRIQRHHQWENRIGNSIVATYDAGSDYELLSPIQKKSFPSDDRNDLERELVDMRNR